MVTGFSLEIPGGFGGIFGEFQQVSGEFLWHFKAFQAVSGGLGFYEGFHDSHSASADLHVISGWVFRGQYSKVFQAIAVAFQGVSTGS